MGADGWLGIGWPKEYGGRGMTPIEQFIFFDESMRAGAPVPMLTVNSVAPTIMQFGTDEQKQFFLPKILKGEIHFAIGYTEPNAGTDLASLQCTRGARRRRLRHQRPEDLHQPGHRRRLHLARGAHRSVADPSRRTSTRASRCSSCRARRPACASCRSRTWASMNTNQTFYDDVRVPAANLVGKLNGGWKLITNQLNHERVTLCSSGMIEGHFEEVDALGQGDDGSPTAAASSISRGCSSTSRASTRASTSCG